MRLAILGSRGVPANYGGFETFAEELGSRLAERGHDVTVYGRDRYVARGLHDLPRHAPGPPAGAPVQVPRDGRAQPLLGGPRAGRAGTTSSTSATRPTFRPRSLLRAAGPEGRPQRRRPRVAARQMGRRRTRLLPRLRMARRAPAVPGRHRRAGDPGLLPLAPMAGETDVLPVWHDLGPTDDDGTLARLGLDAARLCPVRQPAGAGEQRSRRDRGLRDGVATDLPLAIVGDAPYASDYIARLHATTDPRVRFVGAIYGAGYRVLRSHAAAYVQATEVGGTHPALVEAMGARQRDRRQRRAGAPRDARRRGPLLPQARTASRPSSPRCSATTSSPTPCAPPRRVEPPASTDGTPIAEAYETWLRAVAADTA